MKTLVHAGMLNILWLSVVLGVAYQHMLTAAVVFVSLIILMMLEGINREDVKALILGVLLGIVLDGFLQNSGWVAYGQWLNAPNWIPPYWIIILWVGFALSLKVGMRWLFRSYWLGALFLIVGAPLSYFSAEKLGAVELQEPWAVMVFLAIGWWLYFSVLYVVNDNWRTAYDH